MEIKTEERPLFALILKLDPKARKAWNWLKSHGAARVSLDYMLILNKETNRYDRFPDPGAWNSYLPSYGPICLIRRDEDWSIHG